MPFIIRSFTAGQCVESFHVCVAYHLVNLGEVHRLAIRYVVSDPCPHEFVRATVSRRVLVFYPVAFVEWPRTIVRNFRCFLYFNAMEYEVLSCLLYGGNDRFVDPMVMN